MSASRWPVVLFDLDGTLADTIDLIIASYQHALSTIGEEREIDIIRDWIGQSLMATFERDWPGHGENLVTVYRAWNQAHHDDFIKPYAGMTTLLDRLLNAGARLAVVTSKPRWVAVRAMDALDLTDRLPLLTTHEDTTAHKPDPEPLLHAADRLGIEPSVCAYVGDAAVDVLAARAAGMTSIAVTWGAGSRARLETVSPDHLVDSAAELDAVLLV